MSYDQDVHNAKQAVTDELLRFQRANPGTNAESLAMATDRLNKAWDALTDCLVRQRKERDAQILRLVDELAEAKKGK